MKTRRQMTEVDLEEILLGAYGDGGHSERFKRLELKLRQFSYCLLSSEQSREVHDALLKIISELQEGVAQAQAFVDAADLYAYYLGSPDELECTTISTRILPSATVAEFGQDAAVLSQRHQKKCLRFKKSNKAKS